jgi:hypothetical protein
MALVTSLLAGPMMNYLLSTRKLTILGSAATTKQPLPELIEAFLRRGRDGLVA